MRDILPYGKRYTYPHMSVADTLIWERFIEKYPKIYKTVQYDFHIGDGPPFNPLMDDGEDLNQDMLYRLRIDAIGHEDGIIDIIEIKPKASPATIGQVKSYRTLYQRDEEPQATVRAVIVTDKIQPNMEYLCKKEGVQLVLV